MAEKLDAEGYWLPSEFLADDTYFKADIYKPKGTNESSHLFGNSFGLNSDLSSPVESFTGSTETESDEDDFITFLKQKNASSTLHDSKISSDYTTKDWKLCGSPQSTLYGLKPSLNRSSAKCVSGISFPPASEDSAAKLDFFCAAEVEVARLKLNEEIASYFPTNVFSPSMNRNPSTVPGSTKSASGIHLNLRLQAYFAYQRLRATQLNQMRGEIWGQVRNRSYFQDSRRNGERERTQGFSTAHWPSVRQSQQQQQIPPISGIRAGFLPEKKERTGTGVFLPRKYGSNYPDARQKPAGCSPVLLPDRVVHSLNLKLDSIGVPSHAQARGNPNCTPEYEAIMKKKTNIMMTKNMKKLTPQPVINNQEFCLPPEWTY